MTLLALAKWLPLILKILALFPRLKGVLHMSGLNHLLDSLTLRAAHGNMHNFTFRPGKFKGKDVEHLLAERGIRVFERTRLQGGELGFSVRRDQAEWAEYLLCRAGVPLTSALLNPEHDALLNPRDAQPKSTLDRIMRWLDWF